MTDQVSDPDPGIGNPDAGDDVGPRDLGVTLIFLLLANAAWASGKVGITWEKLTTF